VARRLVASGCAVRALVRAGSNRQNLTGQAITPVTGDLTDPASLERAVAGCAGVYHVAADYRMWLPDRAARSAIYRTNVDGTRALLLAAAQAGVPRIVYTSSVATLGLRTDGAPADEDTPSALPDMIGDYKRSKFLAEEAVRELASRGVPVVIVNPSTPVGPGDVKPTPTGRMIVDALTGRMPAYVDTGLNIAHVDDVADGHLLAFERGVVGRRYILGGSNMTLREILGACAVLAGRKPPALRLPHSVLIPAAVIAEGWARLVRGEPRMTVDAVRLARKRMFFTSGRAERELGYHARDVHDAFRDAADWFRAHGYLR
jgi:dihydroflavonol-4-reductase